MRPIPRPPALGRLGAAVVAVGLVAGALVVAGTAPAPAPAGAQVPPFAAIQYGTNGCIEVGVRPDPPYSQPKPFIVPDGYDVLSGYPAFGYDPAGFTPTSGTNACRYNFRDAEGATIGSGYCVQWAAGQQSGTDYDPEPWDGTIRHAGYVRQILASYWPAVPAPAVPSTSTNGINTQRGGVVAMAIHFFTDGVVFPPNYQVPELYEAARGIVADVLARGPLDPPPDPTPTIDGPAGGDTGALIGPFTIGANAVGDVTVGVTGADAFTDAAGTVPFAPGSTLPPGGQLWIRAATPSEAVITASGPVEAVFGTMMVGDPTVPVQRMFLPQPLVLTGRASRPVVIADPPDPPVVATEASATVIEVGQAVSDAVTITGLDGDAALTTTLVGPVAPAAGGCGGVDWAAGGLPVVATFGPEPVADDTRVVTPETALTQVGCYSFGAVLEPDGGPPVALPPGDPSETVLVIPPVVPPPFTVDSEASPAVVATGGQVVDEVTVSGLRTDRRMTLVSTLHGPLAPGADGTCAGLDWRPAVFTVARVLPPVTLRGNGSYVTPPITLDAPGCYSFGETLVHDHVTGGEVNLGEDGDRPVPQVYGLGAPTELVLVQGSEPPPTTPPTDPVVPPPLPPGPAGAAPTGTDGFGPATGDTLARTGPPATGATAAVGVAALAVGAALVVLGRRRAALGAPVRATPTRAGRPASPATGAAGRRRGGHLRCGG